MDRASAAQPVRQSPEAPERPLVAGPFLAAQAPHPEARLDRAPLPSLEWALAQEPLDPLDLPELGHRPPSSLRDEP
jgi:hypothetical protein